MDIEKLIEQLRKSADFEDYPIVASFAAIIEKKYLRDAATALSTLRAENESLRVLVELGNTRAKDYRVMRDRAIKAEEENGKLRAELKKMKQELDAAVDCIYQIEDDLNRGNDNDWAREHIAEWESQKED